MTGQNPTECQALVVRVMMHQPRFHGVPEWPPSPARLFQALVAAAGQGRGLDSADAEALRWLESIAPPTIAAPTSQLGHEVHQYVPNNDLDAKDGRPSEVATIRVAKQVQPRLLQPNVPFVYVWEIPGDDDHRVHASRLCAIAERLYQFGRGIDMAWALAAVLDHSTAAAELSAHPGDVLYPGAGDGAMLLACPHPGALDRLVERFDAAGLRFTRVGSGRKAHELFTQPPMVSFAQVEYGGTAHRYLFDLRSPADMAKLVSWPLRRASQLVVEIRDQVAAHLTTGLAAMDSDVAARVQAAVIGKQPGEPSSLATRDRVRIVPLPSIGTEHTSPSVRRVLVLVPMRCGLQPADVAWACTRVEIGPERVGLVEAIRSDMLDHYRGLDRDRSGAKCWRTITPAALPEAAKRRRLSRDEIRDKPKDARERVSEHLAASDAVTAALRHASVRAPISRVRVQREPFQKTGARAEEFAANTRFAKERLWHVEVVFRSPVRGPLVIGDGRFLGLGLMYPAKDGAPALVFRLVDGLVESADPLEVASALRRAVIARVQDFIGPRRPVPGYVHGHDRDGKPLRDAPHLHFVCDLPRARVMVVAPHGTERWRVFATVGEALAGFRDLRAGAAGRISLEPVEAVADDDPLLGSANSWRSVTPYTVNRHLDLGSVEQAIIEDVRRTCVDSGLPTPSAVRVSGTAVGRGRPMSASVLLEFAVAVRGPLLLGRTRFVGGGVFERADADNNGV